MVTRSRELEEIFSSHAEWLLVAENGKSFSLNRSEVEFSEDDGKTVIAILDDSGYKYFRVNSFAYENSDLELFVAGRFGKGDEVLRIVPRTPASELAANIEAARLEEANRIAAVLAEGLPEYTVRRVALHHDNGRLAQINCELNANSRALALSDLTASMSAEMLLTTAIRALQDAQARLKKPSKEVWLIAAKKTARNLQRLRALLTTKAQSSIRVFEISPPGGLQLIKERRRISFSELWRDKPSKLSLPPNLDLSETASALTDLAPEKSDVIFSKQGETIRFYGLPFARARTLLGKEKAWFGIDRERRLLSEENRSDLDVLVSDLETYRSHDCANKRHELFRLAPEAWLESILRGNIKLLDANLILSPIYHQFRAASDKIDLLAIRKDGRLVIIELKTSPDREMVFQAADYWRKIELQRRRGELKKANLFGGIEIIDKPALVYAVAPALCFHRDFDLFARMIAKEIEIWRFELHENWRKEIKVLARRDHSSTLSRTNL